MIIGISGLAGSGKDTVADHLVRHHGFVKVALADPLKRICREVFDFTDEQLWGPSEMRNKPDLRYGKPVQVLVDQDEYETRTQYLTPRHALQQLGTEWGRACYPNVWVEYAIRVAKTLLKKDYPANGSVNAYHAMTGLRFSHFPYVPGRTELPKGVVIPDVRFKNEADAIHAAGGKIWRISRPGAGLAGAAGQHASEQEIKTLSPDVEIHNIVALPVLYEQVDWIMNPGVGP